MNVLKELSMKTTMNSFQGVVAAFAVAFVFVASPLVVTAFEIELPQLPNTLPDLTTGGLTLTKVECNISLSTYEVVTGGSVTVSWDTAGLDEIKINGEVVSSESGSVTIDNITQNTNFELVGTNGNGGTCTASAYLLCLPPVHPPKCTLSAHPQHLDEGNTTTLTWTTENAASVSLVGTDVDYGTVDLNGSLTTDPLTKNVWYMLNVTGENGDEISCKTDVYVYEKDDLECTLVAHPDKVYAGQTSTLTWTTNGADRVVFSGTDVAERDVDLNGDFTTEALSGSAWYMITAYDGHDSVVCKEDVHIKTPDPKPPVCPIDYKDGRIIVDFAGERIWSHRGIEASRTDIQSFNVPAGKYEVRLVSYDGYIGREGTTQNFEQYQLEFLNGSTEITRSNAISDLADRVLEATNDEIVNTSLMLSQPANGLRATHAFYPDNSSANSLYPICASLDPVEEPKDATIIAHKIVCSDESDLPNYGTGGPNITANTAADFVAAHPGCYLQSGWEFEWAETSASSPDDDLPDNPFFGRAGSDWNTFGPTDGSGKAVATIPASVVKDNSFVWFREVLQDGYIPFTFGPGNETNADNVSAEVYCHTDVVNYDNLDQIYDIEGGETYHCVAWNVKEKPVEKVPSCDFFTANPTSIDLGESITLTWGTTNVDQVFINNGVGSNLPVDGSIEVAPREDTTYVLTAIGANDKTDNCHVQVHVDTTPERPMCPFTPDQNTIVYEFDEKLRSDQSLGNSQTDIQTTALEVGKYDISLASWDAYRNRVMVTQPNEQWQLQFLAGDAEVGISNAISDLEDQVAAAFLQEQVNEKYSLTAAADGVRAVHAAYPDSNSANSVDPICAAVTKVEDPAPSCDLFTANPNIITVGGTATLTWETSNATQVAINNGVGSDLPEDGSIEVALTADIVYTLTVFGTDNRSVDCEVPVTVSEDPVPVCKAFTATPGNLPVGGGDVVLEWEVEDATSVTISPTVGSVDLTGSTSVSVTQSTTYTLTAVDVNGDEVSCVAPVTVPDPVPFTCEGNVTFGASPNSVRSGNDVTLTWNVTDADSVSISEINATAFSGTETVNPTSDTTYVLTATKDDETIECPTSVTISTGGGGGGGSSSPRCELDISDEQISLGEEITLTWDTSRANDVTIVDDLGNVIFTTDDMLSTEKDDFLDGEITLSPTRDTEYTLVAERGSRDRNCRVSVDVEDDLVILETRDQQPLVAGISLTAVPYTGFEAGPFMTFMFYALLVAWAFYIAYLIVVRKGAVEVETTPVATMRQAEEIRPDAFVPKVTPPETPVRAAVSTAATPTNLPTGTPAVGYQPAPVQETNVTVTAIEDRAHAQKALLSSDAVRYFVATTEGPVERDEALDEVIAEAKKVYPLEDGWIVINESRMQNLCEVCKVNASEASYTQVASVPEGSSSLAEAIVTGNVVAAYEMIGNRPMFSLADAAADLDAVYRKRQGENKIVSALLQSETENLSDEQIKSMISALTSALDGTYTDEASAVKMAIMKAVKEVA